MKESERPTEFTLYRDPVVLEHDKHRHLKLAPATDHAMAVGMHASFLTAAEFTTAAREFMIVFVRAPSDAVGAIQPLALLGLKQGENLYLDGTRWNAGYVPAFLRRYPFWSTRLQGVDAPVLTFDRWWLGFSEISGDPLYEADGKPAPRLASAIEFIERFEVEALRTIEFCKRLSELDLLRDMTATVTLPDGSTQTLDGLITVDEDKLMKLPDDRVLELHRSGMLGLIHAHMLSLGNLDALVARKARQMQPVAAAG